MRNKFICSLLLFFSLMSLESFARAQVREFSVTAVEVSETKFWLPSNFFVKKGDTVIFHLKNKIKGKNNIHGFSIKDFGVEVLVDEKGLVKSTGEKVEFIANKAGIFSITCHLHPAHVGGQLIVLE